MDAGSTACGSAGAAGPSDSATASAAIRLAIDSFGRFDALYHVAGGSGRRAGDGPLHEVTDDGVAATLQHNLTSLIYSNRAAVQALGVRQMRIGPQIDPGVPWCHAEATACGRPVHLALKSGNFGSSDFFTRAFLLA